jgi:Protein of unknown function (DUF4058)
MPVHDWTRVDDRIFHDFHTVWLVLIRLKLAEILPPEYYILAEQRALGFGPDILAMGRKSLAVRLVENDRIVAVVEIVSPGNKSSHHAFQSFVGKAKEFLSAGVHLLVIDLFPPTPRDPDGLHEAIWGAGSEPVVRLTPPALLTVASYVGGVEERAYVEPLAVGDRLPVMPLFLEPDFYVRAPLEDTYTSAFQAVPQPWSGILSAPAEQGGATNGT